MGISPQCDFHSGGMFMLGCPPRWVMLSMSFISNESKLQVATSHKASLIKSWNCLQMIYKYIIFLIPATHCIKILASVAAGPYTCGLMIVAAMQHETLGSHNHVKWLTPSVQIYKYAFQEECLQTLPHPHPHSYKLILDQNENESDWKCQWHITKLFESCIQQWKTTCLLLIRMSLACARAAKLTTTNMKLLMWKSIRSGSFSKNYSFHFEIVKYVFIGSELMIFHGYSLLKYWMPMSERYGIWL